MSNLTSKSVRFLYTVALGASVAACSGAGESDAYEAEAEAESGGRLGQLIDASVDGSSEVREDDAGSSGDDTQSIDAGAGSSESDASTLQPTGKGCLAPSSNNFETVGPYGVKSKQVTIGQLGAYTIFYPERFAQDCKHPVVGWGNGTGVTGTLPYEQWHRHAASWGIVVIASHNSNAGSQRFIEGGVDYLLKENQTAGSEFNGKLSERAGSAGHSQGGFAATTATRHPNVKAEVNVQGGGTPAASAAMICLTGTEDFVRSQCTASYNNARGPAFLADLQGADHIGTPTTRGMSTPNGKLYVRLYTSWFRCFLGEDDSACQMFRGGKSAPACKLGQYANCDGRNIP